MLNVDLIPFVTDVTLRAVLPLIAFVDFIVTQYASEDDFIHVASHWILKQKVESNLVDTHEHQRHFTGGLRSFLSVFIGIQLLVDAFNLQHLLHFIELSFRVHFIAVLQVTNLLGWTVSMVFQINGIP